jgi:hypothetical protein
VQGDYLVAVDGFSTFGLTKPNILTMLHATGSVSLVTTALEPTDDGGFPRASFYFDRPQRAASFHGLTESNRRERHVAQGQDSLERLPGESPVKKSIWARFSLRKRSSRYELQSALQGTDASNGQTPNVALKAYQASPPTPPRAQARVQTPAQQTQMRTEAVMVETTLDPSPQPSCLLPLDDDSVDNSDQGPDDLTVTVTTFDLESRQSSYRILRTCCTEEDNADNVVQATVTTTTFDLESRQSSRRVSRPAALAALDSNPSPPPPTVVEPRAAATVRETAFDLASQPSSQRVPQRSVRSQTLPTLVEASVETPSRSGGDELAAHPEASPPEELLITVTSFDLDSEPSSTRARRTSPSVRDDDTPLNVSELAPRPEHVSTTAVEDHSTTAAATPLPVTLVRPRVLTYTSVSEQDLGPVNANAVPVEDAPLDSAPLVENLGLTGPQATSLLASTPLLLPDTMDRSNNNDRNNAYALSSATRSMPRVSVSSEDWNQSPVSLSDESPDEDSVSHWKARCLKAESRLQATLATLETLNRTLPPSRAASTIDLYSPSVAAEPSTQMIAEEGGYRTSAIPDCKCSAVGIYRGMQRAPLHSCIYLSSRTHLMPHTLCLCVRYGSDDWCQPSSERPSRQAPVATGGC